MYKILILYSFRNNYFEFRLVYKILKFGTVLKNAKILKIFKKDYTDVTINYYKD